MCALASPDPSEATTHTAGSFQAPGLSPQFFCGSYLPGHCILRIVALYIATDSGCPLAAFANPSSCPQLCRRNKTVTREAALLHQATLLLSRIVVIVVHPQGRGSPSRERATPNHVVVATTVNDAGSNVTRNIQTAITVSKRVYNANILQISSRRPNGPSRVPIHRKREI